VRPVRALLERGLEVFGLSVFAQKVAEGFACELVEALHLIAPEQIKREPGFLVKLHELAPDAVGSSRHRPVTCRSKLRDPDTWNNRKGCGLFVHDRE
jgi:hypothetical protein